MKIQNCIAPKNKHSPKITSFQLLPAVLRYCLNWLEAVSCGLVLPGLLSTFCPCQFPIRGPARVRVRERTHSCVCGSASGSCLGQFHRTYKTYPPSLYTPSVFQGNNKLYSNEMWLSFNKERILLEANNVSCFSAFLSFSIFYPNPKKKLP